MTREKILKYLIFSYSFQGGNYSRAETTAIPRDMLPLDMLTPQIRHYELRQKNSRYANISDLSTPSYAIFDFFQKNSRYANLMIYLPPAMLFFISQKIPDMLILVLYLPLTMPLWVVSKNLDMLILVLTTWRTKRLHSFLFEPMHFLLTWEVKYAMGFNR